MLLRAAGAELVASLPGDPPSGSAWILADPASVLLFDAGGKRVAARAAQPELAA